MAHPVTHLPLPLSVPLMLRRVPKKDTDRNMGLAYGEQWQRFG
jgi:hypothetical protein